ncbi:MAG: hypothetical protein R6U96_05800 [Promethearchaeia archaeon]
MRSKRTLLLLIIFSGTIFPFFLMQTPAASASWLSQGTKASLGPVGLSCYDPAIGVDSDGVFHYVYTLYVPENNSYDIAYGNNSEGVVQDYKELSLGYATNNTKSDLSIDNNNIYVVWQGKNTSLSGDDYEIYYTNNSGNALKDNVIDITDDEGESTDPSIVVVNDYVFVSYYNSTSDDIRIKTNFGENTLTGSAIDPTSGSGCSNGTLSLWKSPDASEWRVDLGYINSDGTINRTYISNGTTGIEEDFTENEETYTQPNSATDLAIASNEKLAAISYVENNNIFITNSSDVTHNKQITSNTYDEGNLDITLNENNVTAIYFVRNKSADSSVIMSTNNLANYYNQLEPIINKDVVPDSDDGLHISGFDVESFSGEGTFIMYDASVSDGSDYGNFVLYYNSWTSLYNDGSGSYSNYEIYENLQGNIKNTGFLIEGLQFSYNTSSETSFDLKIRLEDTVTNVTWENTTTIDGNGGKDYNITVFQPGDYFIARNPVILYLENASNQQDLIKFELDPTQFSEDEINTTSNTENETLPYYMYQISNEGFEGTLFFYDLEDYAGLDSLIWQRDDDAANGISTGEFHPYRHVDMYKFRMDAGERYNMSLTADGTGSENCRLMIFNSTTQITSPDNALFNRNTSSNNGTYFTLDNNEGEKDYYVVIENLQYGATYDYSFEHHLCPMTADLLSPTNLTYTKESEMEFSWDVNPNEGGVVEPDSEDPYLFQLYDSSMNPKWNSDEDLSDPLNETEKSLNLSLIDELELTDGVYYWSIIIKGENGHNSKEIFHELRLDTEAPDRPNMYTPDTYFEIPQFQVNWTEPSDGPFNVSHYELYRGKTSDFSCTPDKLISVEDTLTKTSYREQNMDTEVYYYKVIAVDHVGQKSEPSDAGRYVVAIAGYPDPAGQNFKVLTGNHLEYQFVDVYDKDTKDPSELFAEFNGRNYQINSYIHFWLSSVSSDAVIPVRGNLYKRESTTTAEQAGTGFELVGKEVDTFPLVTSPDTEYQKVVFDVFLARNFEGKSFNYEMKDTKYFDTFQAVDVVVHSYSTNIDYNQEKMSDINFEYDSAIFVVDKNTGVLIELTIYNSKDDKGYALKLTDTNIPLTTFNFIWIPFIIVGILGIVAAIINQIVKRMERRL